MSALSLFGWRTVVGGTVLALSTLALQSGVHGEGPANAKATPQKQAPNSAEENEKPKEAETKDSAVYDILLHSTTCLSGVAKNGQAWSGTGWVLDAERRLVVTNVHVASPKEMGEIAGLTAWFPVIKDGEAIHELDYYQQNVPRIAGTVIFTDSTRDLALVQLESLPEKIVALKLAEKAPPSGAQLHSLAGLPRGSRGLFIYTQGTSRASYQRDIATGGQIQVLETQMPLNQGNSGGPIVNDRGEVVAVFEGLMIEPGVQLVNMCIELTEVQTFLKSALPMVEPKTVAEFNVRGDHHFENARYDQALADYNQALKLDPKNAEATSNRGWVYFQKNDAATAFADFNEAISLNTNLVNAYWGRGTVYRNQQKYKESADDLTQAIRHASSDNETAKLYNERGLTAYQEAKYEEALADYDRAIEKDSKLAWAHANRGDALGQLGRYDEAFQSLDRAIAVEPRNAEFWNIAGNLWFQRPNYDFAVNMYTAAIERNAKEAQYFRNRGGAHRQAGRAQEAVNDLLKSVELAPNNDDFWNELGLVGFDTGRYEPAAAAFSKAIELNGANAVYKRNRGDSYQKAGKHKEAIEDLTKAIEAEDSAELRVMRGNSYLALGDGASAKADFDKATQLDTSYSLHERKYIKIINDSGKTLSVNLFYYTKSTDGDWHWYPDAPENGGEVSYSFAPGESALLFHDNFKVNANRIRLWAYAEGVTWDEFREKDLVVVPDGGYLSNTGDFEVFSYTFRK